MSNNKYLKNTSIALIEIILSVYFFFELITQIKNNNNVLNSTSFVILIISFTLLVISIFYFFVGMAYKLRYLNEVTGVLENANLKLNSFINVKNAKINFYKILQDDSITNEKTKDRDVIFYSDFKLWVCPEPKFLKTSI